MTMPERVVRRAWLASLMPGDTITISLGIGKRVDAVIERLTEHRIITATMRFDRGTGIQVAKNIDEKKRCTIQQPDWVG